MIGHYELSRCWECRVDGCCVIGLAVGALLTKPLRSRQHKLETRGRFYILMYIVVLQEVSEFMKADME